MPGELPDFQSLWNFDDPDSTRLKFTKILERIEPGEHESYRLQLLTQIARTYSLKRRFSDANRILDDVEPAVSAQPPVVTVRYLLERGRTLRSSDKAAESKPLFMEAFDLAKSVHEDNLAVDAAHMVALVEPAKADKRKWHALAVDLAERSKDERARGWLASLYNNMGWDHHESGEYEVALGLFKKAQTMRELKGNLHSIGVTKWCVARTLRSLKRYDEAFTIQAELLRQYQEIKKDDGYVHEELGELYLVKKNPTEAMKHFARANEVLSKDEWFVENETKRLERIRVLSNTGRE